MGPIVFELRMTEEVFSPTVNVMPPIPISVRAMLAAFASIQQRCIVQRNKKGKLRQDTLSAPMVVDVINSLMQVKSESFLGVYFCGLLCACFVHEDTHFPSVSGIKVVYVALNGRGPIVSSLVTALFQWMDRVRTHPSVQVGHPLESLLGCWQGS